MTEKKSVWETLSAINVNSHTEKKNGLTYLSWAWAWGVLKQHYPTATFEKHIQPDGMPYIRDAHGFAYVQVSVTVEGQTATELFPVLDHRNKAVQNPDAFAVNAAMQRALTKAISYHGLGHYIYAGEDLPAGEDSANANGGSAMIKTTFLEFIPKSTSMEELTSFYKKNKEPLATLEKMDKTSHAEVMKAFTQRKNELQA